VVYNQKIDNKTNQDRETKIKYHPLMMVHVAYHVVDRKFRLYQYYLYFYDAYYVLTKIKLIL